MSEEETIQCRTFAHGFSFSEKDYAALKIQLARNPEIGERFRIIASVRIDSVDGEKRARVRPREVEIGDLHELLEQFGVQILMVRRKRK